MTRETVITLDCGASSVALASFVRAREGRMTLTHYSRERLDLEVSTSEGEEQGVEWADFVFERLARRISQRGPVVMTIPAHHVVTKWLETPAVAPGQREKIVRFEASQNVAAPATDWVWDYYPLLTDDGRIEAMLSSVKLTVMEVLCGAAERAGFRVDRVLSPGVALYHAFRTCYPDPSGPFLIANMGARTTQLMYVEGARFNLRSISLGGNLVTQALAGDLKVDLSEAEQIKRQVGNLSCDSGIGCVEDAVPGTGYFAALTPSVGAVSIAPPSRVDLQRAALSRATDLMVGRLQLEITRSLVNHRRPGVPPQPVRILLAGGGSLLAGLAGRLEARLKLPVSAFDSLQAVESSAVVKSVVGGPAVFADLVGMAVTPAFDAAPPFNLLPPHRKRAAALRNRRPALVGAATMMAVSMVPPLWHCDRVVEVASGKIHEIDVALRDLTAIKNRNRENLARIADLEERIAWVREALSTRGNWIGFFADLQARLTQVEDVWLERLQRIADPLGGPPSGAPRVQIAGRLLDAGEGPGGNGSEAEGTVGTLLGLLAQSPFVEVVENERFDRTQPAVLRFEVTLRVKPNGIL